MKAAQEILRVSVIILLAILVGACREEEPPENGGETPPDLATCVTQTVSGPDDTCEPWQQAELCQPVEFSAAGGVLTTALDVEKKWQCVPSGSDQEWEMTPLQLRNYGVRVDGEQRFTYPGPTFRLKRKASPTAPVEGDRFKMLLTNNLGPTTVEDQMQCRDDDPRFANDVHPNCFHGNETTNFHFHGFHISPQPLQDYVLLKLYPEDTPGIPNYEPGMTDEELRLLTAIGGSYRYDVDPLPYNQPEGTHWYHAHHHGATAMQVINGMAGAFLIEGPFDEWLNDQYGYDDGEPKLKDRLLIVQQINDALSATTPLINGQGNPLVPIATGEVQRWRFVSATTQASAQLETRFTGLRVCQIEMDGVRFSDENYQRQPLLQATDGSDPGGCLDSPNFVLNPGNRADFLVQLLPSPEGVSARTGTRLELTQRTVGNVGAEAMERMEVQRNRARVQGAARFVAMDPTPLLTLRVTEGSAEMEFPASLPPMPEFLEPPTPTGPTKEVAYQMYGPRASNPAPVFKIDNMQVRDCVPPKMTVARGTDERWIVRNFFDDAPAPSASAIAHPFHIHTNPFYVVRNGNDEYTNAAEDYALGIWQDTIALPLAAAGEPDPERATSVDLFMEFEDYTGGYVQHCHILGHEDRGMMTLVQTLCPETDAFGTPVADQPDNCEISRPPLPVCDTP